MMRAYVDSDVLIWHLRGEEKAAKMLRSVASDESVALWIGALQRAEVVFFMRENEIAATRAFLSLFKTAAVTAELVDAGGDLYRRWPPSHGIDVNNAILAATALASGGTIYTLNTKHYPMPGVRVQRAWQPRVERSKGAGATKAGRRGVGTGR